ncbi:hypothetical protein O3Q52_41655 [Streptomyces sp. ActVer]|uniref:hypothetical protein n=1 Tax=Streptomyces sp. ActVer TaxID=3014558 RepID=UPI0022B44B04|nr:hypothetical protein [Streptomyces sp. ActVer]MCZ4514530.1 hypothetical protein [Streptomyces sp. ActVer]
MSDSQALVIATVLVFSALAGVWQVMRARQAESERDRIVAEARAHAAVRTVSVTEWVTAGLVDALAAEDPELIAGFERLDDAAHEELRDAAIPEQREEEDR